MENEDKAIEILKGKKFSTIGNFSYNDAFDAIIEMAEYKDAQRRTPSDDTTEDFVHSVISEVACHETELKRQIEQGKAFAESNKTVFDVAMAVAKFYKEQLDLRMDAYARERKALTEVEKFKQELARCRAMNYDYLTAKTEAENRAKLLKQEIADLKVPDSRRERHLRDELHRSRLECQQAWKHANKEMAENKELRERIKHLEADLDEGGFNDLKKDILTLVNLIPCNDGNESVINDIKNLLK